MSYTFALTLCRCRCLVSSDFWASPTLFSVWVVCSFYLPWYCITWIQHSSLIHHLMRTWTVSNFKAIMDNATMTFKCKPLWTYTSFFFRRSRNRDTGSYGVQLYKKHQQLFWSLNSEQVYEYMDTNSEVITLYISQCLLKVWGSTLHSQFIWMDAGRKSNSAHKQLIAMHPKHQELTQCTKGTQ